MTTRLKQLLVALLGGVLCLVMVFLGLWQMQVFESQKSDTTAQRASAPARDLEQNLVDGRVGDLYGRRVEASGSYLPAAQHLVGTNYPLRVVSAFRTTGGRTLAVVRGTVAQGQSVPRPPAGVQRVSGVILPSEQTSPGQSAAGLPAGTFPTLRLEQLVQDWPSPMLDGYVTLAGEQSTAQGLGIATVVIPDTEGGRVRNQGYALQWWAFAAFGALVTAAGVRAVGRSARPE